MSHVWKSDNDLVDSVFSFHCGGPGDQIPFIEFGTKFKSATMGWLCQLLEKPFSASVSHLQTEILIVPTWPGGYNG